MTVDDTTPAPGQVITLNWTYTVPRPDPDTTASTPVMGYGEGSTACPPA
jgi:hypothetical protein